MNKILLLFSKFSISSKKFVNIQIIYQYTSFNNFIIIDEKRHLKLLIHHPLSNTWTERYLNILRFNISINRRSLFKIIKINNNQIIISSSTNNLIYTVSDEKIEYITDNMLMNYHQQYIYLHDINSLIEIGCDYILIYNLETRKWYNSNFKVPSQVGIGYALDIMNNKILFNGYENGSLSKYEIFDVKTNEITFGGKGPFKYGGFNHLFIDYCYLPDGNIFAGSSDGNFYKYLSFTNKWIQCASIQGKFYHYSLMLYNYNIILAIGYADRNDYEDDEEDEEELESYLISLRETAKTILVVNSQYNVGRNRYSKYFCKYYNIEKNIWFDGPLINSRKPTSILYENFLNNEYDKFSCFKSIII